MNISRDIADWQTLRGQVAEIDAAEHPDVVDEFGRTWVWKAKDLYTHDDALAFTRSAIDTLGLPSPRLTDNPNYDLCSICTKEWPAEKQAERLPDYWAALDFQEQRAEYLHGGNIARDAANLEVGQWVYVNDVAFVRIQDLSPDRYDQISIREAGMYPRKCYLHQVKKAAEKHAELQALRAKVA